MAQSTALLFYVDGKDLKELERLFQAAPREIRRPITKEWRAEGKKGVRYMKRSHFSGPTNADKLRHRTPSQRRRASGKPLRSVLAVKKVKFGRGGTFGGYIIIGFKGLGGEPKKTHPLINIYEFNERTTRFTKGGASRGSLKTREPLSKAWEDAKGRLNFIRAIERGIDKWMNS